MNAGRKFAGLWLMAMLFYYRTAVAIILAVLFAFGCWLIVRTGNRSIGRARRLWHRLSAVSLRIPARSTVLSNLKREVAVARRSAWQPITDDFIRRFGVKPEQAPLPDETCPECGSYDVQPRGNTSYRCVECGTEWP